MRKNFPDLTYKYQYFNFFYVGYLSNWYMASFTDLSTGMRYSCAEQFLMHKKALLFNDLGVAEKIMLKGEDPAECKALGRMVKGFDQSVWGEEARPIAYAGCYFKFSQNKDLLKKLNSTKGTLLVEASPSDKVWGIGMGAADIGVQDPRNWKGTNWLGQVLTYVREDLSGK